jgi:hypothetical protein
MPYKLPTEMCSIDHGLFVHAEYRTYCSVYIADWYNIGVPCLAPVFLFAISLLVREMCSCTCHEGILENGVTAPLILNRGTWWSLLVSFTLLPLYPLWKSHWYSVNRRLGGPQSPSWRSGEEQIICPLPAVEPRFLGSACSPVTVSTALPDLVSLALLSCV